MSKTRTFRIGHVEAFQDKPSEELQRAIKSSDKDIEKCGLLVRSGAKQLAETLADKSEQELIIVLKFLVRVTKKLKNSNNL